MGQPLINRLAPPDRAQKPYSPAVVVSGGRLMFISGQTARDGEGSVVGLGDVVEQTRRAMGKIGEILVREGASYDGLVKLTMFLARMEDLPVAIEARSEILGDVRPASTAVQAVLPPDILIEIEAIAVLEAE